MEFNVRRETFLGGVQKTIGIVEKKTTLPILNNLLVKIENNRLVISATDLEVGLIAEYEANVVKEGKITLSARKLYEMIREMQGDVIHVVMDDRGVVRMTCQKAIYKIQGLAADDFPDIVYSEDINFFRVNAYRLVDLIRKTSFAVSSDPLRKNLTGVFFEVNKDSDRRSLRMVATDGHRLATADADIDVDSLAGLEKGIIIPRKGLSEIRKNLEGIAEEVSIGVQQGMCVVKTDGITLKISLIDAEYPDYRRVMPSEKGVEVRFEKEKVLHSLRRMSVISSDNYQGVIVKIFENRMVLNSTNPDVGEANDEIDVVYQGKEVDFAYNVNFLIDAIEVVDSKEVIFEIGGAKKPAIIRSAENSDYYCIIMPLKY